MSVQTGRNMLFFIGWLNWRQQIQLFFLSSRWVLDDSFESSGWFVYIALHNFEFSFVFNNIILRSKTPYLEKIHGITHIG